MEVVRGLWGAVLLIDPDRVLGSVHGLRIDAKSRAVARILGGRHLVQALLSGYRPSAEVLAMGVWVDTVHSLTAAGLATLDRTRSQAGAVDAVVAASWAGIGLRDLQRGHPTPRRERTTRDRLALLVLRRAPGGQRLRNRIFDEAGS